MTEGRDFHERVERPGGDRLVNLRLLAAAQADHEAELAEPPVGQLSLLVVS